MKTIALGTSPLHTSRIAQGCMPFGGSWDRSPVDGTAVGRARGALRAALDAGIDCFDHADIYCHGKSEEVFAQLITEFAIPRAKIVVQSKCGIIFGDDPVPGAPHRFDYSFAHIVTACERSLKRLNTDYLDCLLLHRPDALVEPEEVARAFDQLHASGKVRDFGVSNHNAGQMDLLRKHLRQPLIVNQVELSLVHTHLIDAGIVTNQNQQSFGAESTLDYCRLHKITLQAWAPLAGGRALGSDKNPKAQELARLIGEIAAAKGVSSEAIPIAWLLRHPAGIQPVIGSTDPARIAAACQADKIELSREEWYALYAAGRGEKLP